MNPTWDKAFLKFLRGEEERDRRRKVTAADIPRAGQRAREAAITASFRLAAHYWEGGK